MVSILPKTDQPYLILGMVMVTDTDDDGIKAKYKKCRPIISHNITFIFYLL
jgi:hypothetical protein